MAFLKKWFGMGAEEHAEHQSVPRQVNQPAAENASVTDAAPTGAAEEDSCGIWIAVRGANTQEVAQRLGLMSAQQCRWNEGIRESAIRQNGIFVTKPVNNTVLVTGRGLPDFAYRHSAGSWLAEFSVPYTQVLAMMVQPKVAVYAFLYAEQGAVYRIYVAAQGGIKRSLGARTDFENALGFIFPDNDKELEEGIGFTVPGEKTICSVASNFGGEIHQFSGASGIWGTIEKI